MRNLEQSENGLGGRKKERKKERKQSTEGSVTRKRRRENPSKKYLFYKDKCFLRGPGDWESPQGERTFKQRPTDHRQKWRTRKRRIYGGKQAQKWVGKEGGGRCRGPSLSEWDCEEPSLITTCFTAFSQGCFGPCVMAQMTRKYKLSKSSWRRRKKKERKKKDRREQRQRKGGALI